MTRLNAFRFPGLVACCLLLVAVLVSAALAQSGGPYHVESGAISGGEYRVTMAHWHVSGAADGGSYRLPDPAASELPPIGCCCTYLPCVLRQSP